MAVRSRLLVGRLDCWWIGATTLALLAGPVLDSARAQQETPPIIERMKSNTVTIVTSSPSLGYATYGFDLAVVLDQGDELRILPIMSLGTFQNIRDIRYLRGVDLGFAQTNILGYFRRTGELGNLAGKIVYVAKLFNEEIHVIVRSDVTSLEQLRGRKVNFSTPGSDTQLSARDIFQRFKIPVEEVNLWESDGLEKLRNGEIAATVLSTGKPSDMVSKLKASDGYRILAVPWAQGMPNDYLPASLTHDDYPDLIAPGENIDTIATGTVLFAYNWAKNSDRYRRIDKFVKAFFSKVGELQKPPRHPKWRETNLAATIPGWKRFEGAEEWLAAARARLLSESDRNRLFEDFVRWSQTVATKPLTESDRNRLFEDFLKWSQTTGSNRR
jgi:uncharacterized protein